MNNCIFFFLLKKNKVLSAILILLLAFLVNGCTEPQDLAKTHYNRGIQLFQAEDYQGAILELRNALQLDPRLSEAHYQLGLAYIEIKDAVNAYRELEIAAQVDPTNVDAMVKAAEMLFKGKEINESRKRLKNALAQDPNHVNGLILAANIELQAKHLNEAEAYIERAHELAPNLDRVYLAHANIHLAKKNYDLVREAIEKALAVNPQNQATYKALILYWLSTNNLIEAEKTLMSMFEVFPDSPQPYLEIAKIQERSNDLAGAAANLEKAIDKDPQNPELHITAARFYEKHGQLERAESSYRAAVNFARNTLDYKALLADFYYNQKEYEAARIQVEQVLAAYPEHMYANFVQGKILLDREERLYDVLALFDKLTVKNPQWGDVLFYKARVHYRLHEINKAFKTIVSALAQSPEDPDYLLLYANLLHDKGDISGARQASKAVLEIKPNSYAAAILYSKTLYLTQSYQQAIDFLTSLDMIKPDDFEILQYLGLSQMAVNDFRSAKPTLNKAVSLKSGHTLALEALVNIHITQNQNDAAISLLEKQLAITPSSPVLLLLYGSLLYIDGRLEEALTVFRQVKDTATDLPAAYMMEALTLKRLGEFDAEIAKRFREVAHRKTVDPESQMILAKLLEISGDLEGAKDAYRRVLELSPGFPAAANNLAWLLANDGNPEHLAEAMNLAQTAKEKQPTDPNIADTLGWIYYKQERYYVAAYEFQQAINNAPTTPVYHYHLALALERKEMKMEAIKAVKQSLKLNGFFAEKDQAEALYKKLTGRNFK